MPIINPKERAFRPFFILSILRFNDVQNYWYSIFIVISHKSLMSISWVCSNESVSLHWHFRSIKLQSIYITCRYDWLGLYNSFISFKSEKVRICFLFKSWKFCHDGCSCFWWLGSFICVFVWDFNVWIVFRDFYFERTILLCLEYFQHFLRLNSVGWKLKLLRIFCLWCLWIISR